MELLFLSSAQDPAAVRIARALDGAGYSVRYVVRTLEAEHLRHGGSAEALVAEAGLLDHEAVARIRRDCPAKPVVAWLTQASSDRSAELLEAGFSEVLDAAMGERELIARVATTLRRNSSQSLATVEFGPLQIEDETGEARWDGVTLRLTRRERQVLQVLAQASGRTVRRDRLYRLVWGYAMARGDRSVDVNITRLRAKLGDATGGSLEIVTQLGVGYRLEIHIHSLEAKPVAGGVTSL